MDWIKDENGSMNIIYSLHGILIQTKQYFDNVNFYIEFKAVSRNHDTLF